MTTATREDYIRAIHKLGGNARSIDVAASLGLAKSTVSERLKDLAKEKLVSYHPYSTVAFTPKGRRLGEKLTYKHRIIECFLHETLGFSATRVHEEAHKLEHAFSDESVRRLAKLLGNPQKDPHGRKIAHV